MQVPIDTPVAAASLRRRLYVLLDPTAWPKKGLSPLNRVIAILICVAVALAILESEPVIYARRERLFFWSEVLFIIVFTTEYAARIWVAAENPAYAGRWGRLRYAVSFPALIDLIALLPLLLTLVGSEAFLLRLFRLARILRLARLGRYSSALDAISYAIRSRRYELYMSLSIAGLLLLVSSTLLYVVESETQPDTFGSIPRAMWWSIATLTTVGYGDAFPVTPIGKILAGFTAITGIGIIAMPTGILAAAFSEALQKQRAASEALAREAKANPRETPEDHT
jgi:voltage-gated potassium channel